VDITTGRLLLVVPCDEDDFTAFALAPSGTELVTAGRSRQLRSWVLDVGVTTCEFTRVWKAHKMPVMDLAYDASGRFVASGSADSTAMVFDVAKGIATHVFRGHTGVVHLVRFHPDASRLHLYTSGADNGVRVWDLRSRACVATRSRKPAETSERNKCTPCGPCTYTSKAQAPHAARSKGGT
jgi:U3 small nucleolar RNA-associated protein 13